MRSSVRRHLFGAALDLVRFDVAAPAPFFPINRGKLGELATDRRGVSSFEIAHSLSAPTALAALAV